MLTITLPLKVYKAYLRTSKLKNARFNLDHRMMKPGSRHSTTN